MKKIDDLYLFPKFAHEHIDDYDNGQQFIIYAVGSPILSDEINLKNRYRIPLYLLVKQSSDNHPPKYDITIYMAPYIQFLHIHPGDEILKSGQVRPLKDNPRYQQHTQKHGFGKEVFTIEQNDLIHPEKITLAEVAAQYRFFNKSDILLKTNAKDEIFYKFKSNRGVLLISAVEIVRYFYVSSAGPSLLRNILRPDGSNYLYTHLNIEKYIEIDGDTYPSYRLDLHAHAHIADFNKIFYFMHNEEYKDSFASIYLNYLKTKKFNATIPTNHTISIRTDYIQRDGIHLVTRIRESDIASYMENWHIDYYHPLSKPYSDDPPKPPENKPPKPRERSSFNNEIGDDEISNPGINPIPISDPDQFFGEGAPDKPKFILGPKSTHILGVEKKQKTIPRPPQYIGEKGAIIDGIDNSRAALPKGTRITKREKSCGDKQALPLPIDEPDEDISKLSNIDYSYKIASALTKKGVSVSLRVESAVQIKKSKSIEKNYTLMAIEISGNHYFYVDIFPKVTTLGKIVRKEILLVRYISEKQTHTESLIKQLVHEQISRGNHRWCVIQKEKQNSTSKKTSRRQKCPDAYKPLKHSSKLEAFVENLISALKSL